MLAGVVHHQGLGFCTRSLRIRTQRGRFGGGRPCHGVQSPRKSEQKRPTLQFSTLGASVVLTHSASVGEVNGVQSAPNPACWTAFSMLSPMCGCSFVGLQPHPLNGPMHMVQGVYGVLGASDMCLTPSKLGLDVSKSSAVKCCWLVILSRIRVYGATYHWRPAPPCNRLAALSLRAFQFMAMGMLWALTWARQNQIELCKVRQTCHNSCYAMQQQQA